MAQAKTLSDANLDALIDAIIETSRNPTADVTVILLSFKAGLRACEIAGLCWNDVTDARGQLTSVITVPKAIAKKGHGREIHMHPVLREALETLKEELGPFATGKQRIIRGATGTPTTTPNALVQRMIYIYERHGFQCSSHSGRRTMITKMAKRANEYDCSLKDVQRVAGHRFIATTEVYVDYSPNIQQLIEAV